MIQIAVLLATAAAPAAAPQAAAKVQVQPAPDSADSRQALRKLVMCVAKARPRWARQTLAHPYLSDAQARAAAEVLTGQDSCLAGPEADMTFRTSTLVGSLAEHFVRTETPAEELARLAKALNTAAALNGSEDFALCVAARDPNAARELALSEPGSPAETQAAGKLAHHVPPCTRSGENLVVDLQSLRALTATALYRAIVPSSGSGGR